MSTSDTERANRVLVRAKVLAWTGRETAIKRLSAIAKLATKVSSDPSLIPKLLVAADDLDTLWDSFMSYNVDVLNALIDLDQMDEFSTDLEGEVRDLYFSTHEVVFRHCSRKMAQDSRSSGDAADGARINPINRRSRLPEIPLPTFFGSLFEWPVFRDRFEALTDQRTGLSNIERFYYLLGCLKDQALCAIANIPVSEANYTLAWSSLVEHFDKPRQLAVKIVEKLLNSPVQMQETLGGLKYFLSLFAANVTMLKSLGIPDLGNFLLFVLSSRCLSLDTRREFESRFTGCYSGVNDFMEFIKTRVATFEVAGTPVIVYPFNTAQSTLRPLR